jgi:hypothetical protein
MKRTMLLVVAAALGTGCGGPPWDGTYSGTLSYTDNCGGSDSQPESWTITQNGSVLTILPLDTTCGAFTADINGSTATLRQKTCPPYTDSTTGYTYYPEITGGTISLQNTHLTGTETYLNDFSGPSYPYQGTCSGTAAIDLYRH